MVEQGIEAIVRGFSHHIVRKEVGQALAFFAEDGSWVTPEGTFKGKEELKRYLTWVTGTTSDMVATGAGIVVQGSNAVYEHVLKGAYKGAKWEALALCAYEFSGENIHSIRSVYDRLSIAKQTARGIVAPVAVNLLVKGMERGLH